MEFISHCAELEHSKLDAERSTAVKELQLAHERIDDLVRQLEDLKRRHQDIKTLEGAEREALLERHRSQIDELQASHERVLSGLKASHDNSQRQLGHALDETTNLRKLVEDAECAKEAVTQEMENIEVQLRMHADDLKVRSSVSSRLLVCAAKLPRRACDKYSGRNLLSFVVNRNLAK
jgi:predicted  nucleic acid-binding Zn-ribbon protein